MTKDEFIKKVLFAFRDFFSDEAEKQYWITNYNIGISNYNVDYEKLYKKFLTEYKSNAKRPPMPSWFCERYNSCRISKQEEELLKITGTGSPPPPEWYEMKKMLQESNRQKRAEKICRNNDDDEIESIGQIFNFGNTGS